MKKERPIHLSASAIKDFVRCPAMHYYRVNYRGEQVVSDEMVLGTMLHKLFETITVDTTLEEALGKMDVLKAEYSFGDNFNGKIRSDVEIFLERFAPIVGSNDISELEFKVPLPDMYNPFRNRDVFLVGKIDRIVVDSNIVIDWKTGTKVPKSINHDIQFILYDEIYKMLYGSYPYKTMLASTHNGVVVGYKRDEVAVKALYEDIIPAVVQAYDDVKYYYKSGIYTGACGRCSYRTICLDGEEVV